MDMNNRYCFETLSEDAERISESSSHLSSIAQQAMQEVVDSDNKGTFVPPSVPRDRFPYGTRMEKIFLTIDAEVLRNFRIVCAKHRVSMAKVLRRELRALAHCFEVGSC